MASDLIKVRASNDGDEFHILWTARRLLRLLTQPAEPKDALVAVKIEGVSPTEGAAVAHGLLGVDTTEYYGSEGIETASKIIYYQLKHATTQEYQPLSAADIGEFIGYFIERYSALVSKFGRHSISGRFSFVLVTNRPISINVTAAVSAARVGQIDKLGKAERNALDRLEKDTGLTGDELGSFLKLVDLPGKEPRRASQSVLLERELAAFIPGRDPDVMARLPDLVRSQALPEARNRPPLRREDVLNRLNVTPEDLFPAAAEFPPNGRLIPRTHGQAVVDAIIAAQWPVLVTAPGGTGKTVLAQTLESLLPVGSKTVVFDGFCGGAYRRLRQPRHRPQVALTQICNELAVQGLCDPLLPRPAEDHEYYQAFRQRVKQAAAAIRANAPEALVVIILDAADNSAMAAADAHERPFVWGLLQEAPPEGCRVIAFARPYRADMLRPHLEVIRISFDGFTEEETAAHLRLRLPDADIGVTTAFHRLTAGNPRVQDYFLSQSPQDGAALIALLGRASRPIDVDAVITTEIERALAQVREYVEIPGTVDQFCFLLGQLPPLVPVPVLACAAGVPEAAVHSFIADLRHPLLIREEGVQFRDEPVEHWFHQHFPGKAEDYARAADRLGPLARSNAYVAMTLPRLLYEAGRLDGLMALALSDEGPAGIDPVSQRDIVRMRIAYALRATLRDNRQADTAKLFIRAAEVAATRSRQARFIREHADLFAVLMKPGEIADLLFRQHREIWRDWGFAHRAAIFALSEVLAPEAQAQVRQASRWIIEQVTGDQKFDRGVFIDAMAAMTHAGLLAFGTIRAFQNIKSWNPWVRLRLGRRLASRLIDHGQEGCLSELCATDEPDAFFHLGALVALDEVSQGHSVDVSRALGALLLAKNPLEEIRSAFANQDDADVLRHGAVILAEWLAQAADTDCARDLLSRYRPGLSEYVPTFYDGEHYREAPDQRLTLLRAIALDAVLDGRDATLDDLKPDSLKAKAAAENRRETSREFEEIYGSLLPMFMVRAQGLADAQPPSVVAEAIARQAHQIAWNDYRYASWQVSDVLRIVPRYWLDSALRLGFADTILVQTLDTWIAGRKRTYMVSLLIQLARSAARHPSTRDAALLFADRAEPLIAGSSREANETAALYGRLARAILAISHEQANSILAQAARLLDRLGDDARDRLETIVTLAYRLPEESGAGPADTYRLARVAEAVESVSDHKFPWNRVAAALSRLSPASAIAIVSRWRDRGKGRIDKTLPELALDFVERNLITPTIAAALEPLGVHWDRAKSLDAFLTRTPSGAGKRAIFEQRCHDILTDGEASDRFDKFYDLDKLIAVGRSHGLDTRKLESRKNRLDGQEKTNTALAYSPAASYQDTPPDWDSLLTGKTWNDGRELDMIFDAAEALDDHRISASLLLHTLRERTPRTRQAGYVRALAGSLLLPAERVMWELSEVAKSWNGADVRAAVRETAEQVLESRALEYLGSGFGLAVRIQDMVEHTQWPRERVVRRLAEAAAEQLDQVAAGSLLVLGEELSGPLSASDNLDILRFSLDRFEPTLEDQDGDGRWDAALAPMPDLDQAIAGLLWAALGAPEITNRWLAAHAVRRLCGFGGAKVLGHLVDWMDRTDAGPFVDRGLLFYALHARLFLLIALARAALDLPALIAPYLPAIARHAVDPAYLPHAIIRLYARDVCLAVETALPGSLDAGTVSSLRQVGISRHPPIECPPWNYYSDDWLSPHGPSTKELPPFDYDMARYGFSALGDAFGMTAKLIAPFVADWCHRLSSDDAQLGWEKDQRHQRRILRSEDTYGSRHGYSKADDQSFYLTIHGMMCAAGELHDNLPLAMKFGQPSDLGYWVENHRLCRSDGRWLADRRDPAPPLASQPCRPNQTAEGWLSDFDDSHLTNTIFDLERENWLVIAGNWVKSTSYGIERFSVSSTLANPRISHILARKLESFSDPWYCYFPPGRLDRDRIVPRLFRFPSLSIDQDTPDGIDKYDPLSGSIRYPPLKPRDAVRRLLDLKPHDDERVWRSAQLGEVFRSQLWGRWNTEDRYSRDDCGSRLLIAPAGREALLRRTGRDLVIWVRTERALRRYGRDTARTPDRQTRCRAIVVKADGVIRRGRPG
jgi:hypothetical protein